MHTFSKQHKAKALYPFHQLVFRQVLLIGLLGFSCAVLSAQTILNSLNTATFTNYEDAYNFTYWKNSWMTNGADRAFVNHTSSYALEIDYTNLNCTSLLIDESPATRALAFQASHADLFPQNYGGAIDYAILQNGVVAYDKSSTPTATGIKDSQVAEFGVWRNTRFVDTKFTNNAPVESYFTGIEFSTWHNRLKLTFHVRPTADIVDGQLQFSFEMPAAYSQYLTSGNVHAFALPTDKGFVLKAGSTAGSMNVVGNVVTVLSPQQDLLTGESYEVSLLFYALTDNLATEYATVFDQESSVLITANQVAPNNSNLTNINFDADQGIHFIEIPRVNMGYFNCPAIDVQQRVNVQLNNTSNEERRVRLCLFRNPSINVTGFNSLICNANGDPSGLPLQVSKNWHTGTPQYYFGSWINEYTEIILPANTTLNFQYKGTAAKWGETYSASSHQLSVAGSGVPRGGWLEAALGTFGENITHSPDYQFGNTNGADIRPFLVTNQAYGLSSSECGWTGNSGGLDMWVYQDASNIRQYQSQVKTDFKKYSPNLTETSLSAFSADGKLKLDYTFYLNRSDDHTRIYYKLKIKALANVSFNRFDIFQLGGDIYNIHNTQSVAYGNEAGLVGTFLPTNDGSNDYTTAEIALSGTNPWVWAGDGLNYDGVLDGIEINTNNGMIIRNYEGVFNGVQNNTPYLRERSSSIGFSASYGTNPTSYCLVPPPGVTSFSTGDCIDLTVEVAILPKQAADYYGPNQNFLDALTLYGNTYNLLLREVTGNQVTLSSSTHNVTNTYPKSVETIANEAEVTMAGGNGYVPIVFTGLSQVDDPVLWKKDGLCWELVDQSVHGKDFWQAEYNQETGLYDLIYNVNQDQTDGSLATIDYFLGLNHPVDACSPLPVEFVEFSAKAIRQDALLEWTTASEQNNSHFVVERSFEGANWEPIGRVNSLAQNGNSQTELRYQFVDQNAANHARQIYYRLKQIDWNGAHYLSPKRVVLFVKNPSKIAIYPNPILQEEQLNLHFSEEIKSLKIYNLQGMVVTNLMNVTGQTTTSISIKNLAKGVYTIVVNGAATEKLVVW